MDWVRPIAREVGQEPVLRAVLLHREAEGVAIHELAIDRPLSVQAIKLEGPDDSRRIGCSRQRVKLLPGRREAVVLHLWSSYLELQDQVACASWLNCGDGTGQHLGALRVHGLVLGEELAINCYRPLAVNLVQAIFKVKRLA